MNKPYKPAPADPDVLLRKFQPRFRKVELIPMGFGVGKRVEKNHFIFCFRQSGARKEMSDYRDGDQHAILLFDVKEGKCDFPFQYDWNSDLTVDKQLDAAASKVILAGPLADTFFIDPARGHDVAEVLRGAPLPLELSRSGDKAIPGLIPPKDLQAGSWRFFIPNDTPEYRAIEIAVRLAQRQSQSVQVHLQREAVMAEAGELSHQLTAALAEAA